MRHLRVRIPVAAVMLGLLCVLGAQVSLLLGVLTAVVLGGIGGVLVMRPVFRTSSSLETAARAIAAGNYEARSGESGPGEMGTLANAFNDMAQSVQAHMAAASEGRSRLMAALDSSVDPVIAFDTENRVLFANLAAQRLFERDAGEIQNNSIAWLLPHEDVIDAVRSSRDRGTQGSVGIEFAGRRFFQVVTSPIGGGGEWSVLMVIHDVTEVKRTEQVRRDFVANVSHELRTPLAGIKAVVETLAEGALEDREAAQDFLSRADSEVDRLILLVEELLELSRIESGELPFQPRPTDVGALVRDVVERLRPVAERKHVDLTVEVGETVEDINLDQGRMERAFINLVQNAVKFTPDGGGVHVSLRRLGNDLVFRVKDTGIGIDETDQTRVFERFYKADQSRAGRGGSGIGLAIVKHAVEAHGGTVAVESRLGEGSTFTVCLPIEHASGAA